jgi:hypothetical protein
MAKSQEQAISISVSKLKTKSNGVTTSHLSVRNDHAGSPLLLTRLHSGLLPHAYRTATGLVLLFALCVLIIKKCF